MATASPRDGLSLDRHQASIIVYASLKPPTLLRPTENTVREILTDITDRHVNLILYSLAVTLRTARYNIQKFYMVLALRWVFCTDIRTNSDFCFIHHKLIGFYNRGGKFLLRGKD